MSCDSPKILEADHSLAQVVACQQGGDRTQGIPYLPTLLPGFRAVALDCDRVRPVVGAKAGFLLEVSKELFGVR